MGISPQLQTPIPKFEETSLYTIHHIPYIVKNPFRGESSRNDWVWVLAGNEGEFGALQTFPGSIEMPIQAP
jgi:hypothetical protein